MLYKVIHQSNNSNEIVLLQNTLLELGLRPNSSTEELPYTLHLPASQFGKFVKCIPKLKEVLKQN